ncbi:MAG TPA: hypothetical protein VKJ00_07870 [Thermoanaerobaculia bacterium]|nr:hypothetical protein [Thermoanaerobaculia bacterium]HMF09036.1 hypothetical protein [Thermoanaerobaculia bacterium]
MAEKKSEPPRRTSDSGRGAPRPRPEQYEMKVRWEKARRVVAISPTGAKFDFDTALKVGTKYPVSLSAPGVSFSSTLEVTRCQVTVEPGGVRYFRIDGRFFPYLE